MAILTSKVGKLKIGDSVLGEVNNASLAVTIDVAETTEIGDTWKTNLSLGKSWTLSASLIYNSDNTGQALMRTEFMTGDGEVTALKMYEDGTKYFQGNAIITSFNITKGINAADALSVSFVGDSTLSYN